MPLRMRDLGPGANLQMRRRLCRARGLLHSRENDSCARKTLRQLNGDLHARAQRFLSAERSAQYDAGNWLITIVPPFGEPCLKNINEEFIDSQAFEPNPERPSHQQKNDWRQEFRFCEFSARLLEFWWRHRHGARKVPAVFRKGESRWRLPRILQWC